MKKITIVLVFIITIILYHNFIFASYDSIASEDELYTHVEQVFNERTKIWNNILIGEYLSISQLEKELEIIITDPLLKSDMKMFKQMLSTPTSHEGISNVSIKNINIIKNSVEKVILEVLILWEIEDYENNYDEELGYIVEMKKNGSNWLLSDYKINNNI